MSRHKVDTTEKIQLQRYNISGCTYDNSDGRHSVQDTVEFQQKVKPHLTLQVKL